LEITTPADSEEIHVRGLASIAVDAIRTGLEHRLDPAETIREVINRLFLGGTRADELDRVPTGGGGSDHHLSTLLADPVALAGLVDRVLRIVRDEPAG
jgi:hypothetical protein